MSFRDVTIEPAFPLNWPSGRPRIAERKPALFRAEGRSLTWSTAHRRLREQVSLVTPYGRSWRMTELVLSTNIRFTASGARDRNLSRREPEDVGAALYFALDGKPHVLACDRWDTVQDNLAAIAAHIEALRGQERWGVADLREAFAGHVALPAPASWWTVLGVQQNAPLSEVTAAFRQRAKDAHPDTGGDRAAWDRLNDAYDAAREAKR